jgi:hypothetical protein
MDSPQNDVDPPQADCAQCTSDVPLGESQGPAEGMSATSRDGRRPLRISVLLVGSLTLGVLAALTPRYETNDDAGMNAIVAGHGLVDRPDEHLLFSNVLIGSGLKSLYQVAPQIPWYGGFLFVTGCLSLGAICFVCLRQDSSEWKVGMIGVFLWVAGIPALTQLQFTRIGFLAGLAGLLLLTGALRAPGAARQKWLAIPFLVTGGLIRYDALRLVCVVLFPVIAWIVWRARMQKSARVAVLILVACITLSYGANSFNTWYYQWDAGWRDYYPFSARRVEFIDYGHVEYNPQTAEAFASAGWLPIDLQMLRNWAFLDRERYNSRSLQTILDALPVSNWQPPRPWHTLINRLAADSELWGLLACGAACLAILATDRAARFVPLACYGVAGITCIFLYRNLHLPPRVYCPVFSGCAIAAIAFSAGPRSFGKRRAWAESAFGRYLALALVGAVVVWRAGAIWHSNANFLSYHKEAVQMMKQLAPKPNQLFVVWAGDFPLEYVTLPLESQSLSRDFKVLDLNWTLGFSKPRTDEFHVTDLISIVRRGDGTFLVCQRSQTELLSAYIRVHYGVELKYRVAFAHHALYDSAVYQVTIAGAAPRSP